ncbi:GH3 auxin-responsive promoter family protein [Flectobacillus sp. DC10W]|uniref:GH3 auxin-responsive promoter family protein n=1 Tax=Flectobacillus longus TaxID=2984207 RepID=A0ABT6YI56_9BACT|nr:GH3 auxin-responsive promoter family protein [Flectobacillus longus]MDI9863097.1 GH3 auxin-responsive promoter family protein [Flectobacillus longus]
MAIVGNLLKKGIGLTTVIQRKKTNHAKLQKKTLIKLLNKARFTQFGDKFNFEDIMNAALFSDDKEYYTKFKNQVPVYDYNKMYAEWWYKAHEGEKNVAWPGRVKYFALSSGTSEAASKHIPVTKDMVKAIHRTSIRQILSLGAYKNLPPQLYEKGYLMLGGSTELQQMGTHYEGDLSGITAGKIPFWFERFYKPGKKIAATRDWSEKLDKITKQAKNWDIGFIVGVPAWIQLLMEKIIKEYGVNNIHDIWPNLEIFCHGGVSFEPYKQGFEKLLGRPITYIETYLASEGFLAYQTHPNSDMRLVLNNGIFFEFVPFNENNFDSDGTMVERPETLMIDEVEEGKEYALLISTVSGTWRYLIGDTIKFTNKKNAEIVITGRTKHFLSLCGEHLSVDNMNKAIELASKHFNIDIREFTVVGKKAETTFAHNWYVGTDDKIEEAALEQFIDKTLCEINDDYPVERKHALREMKVHVLPTKTFYDFLASKGKTGGQNKFPRVIKKKEQIEDWENFLSK